MGLRPFLAGVKADPGLGLLGRVEQLAQGVEDDLELLAVLTEAVFEGIHFAGCQKLNLASLWVLTARDKEGQVTDLSLLLSVHRSKISKNL